jgi:hypothetical protein
MKKEFKKVELTLQEIKLLEALVQNEKEILELMRPEFKRKSKFKKSLETIQHREQKLEVSNVNLL